MEFQIYDFFIDNQKIKYTQNQTTPILKFVSNAEFGKKMLVGVDSILETLHFKQLQKYLQINEKFISVF